MLVELLLRQTGVGALPLEPPQVPDPRPDPTRVEEETRTVQALYERQQRIQDGAGVVAGFLSFAGAGEAAGFRGIRHREESVVAVTGLNRFLSGVLRFQSVWANVRLWQCPSGMVVHHKH